MSLNQALVVAGKCLLAAATAYVFVVALLSALQTRLIYPGAHAAAIDPAADGQPSFRPARLTTGDGLDLSFWAYPPRPGMPSILVFHGNGASAGAHAFIVRPYVDAGYGVVMAEFRGYAGNPGTPAEAGITRDAGTYRDWMEREWHVTTPVVMGISIGTGPAVALAARGRVAALILDAPLTSLLDNVAGRIPVWVPRFAYRSVWDNLSAIRSVTAPVVVLHGEADPILPVEQGRQLYAAAPCKYGGLFLREAGHTLLATDRTGAGAALVLALLDDVRAGSTACKG